MSLVRKFFTLEKSDIELWIYVDQQDNPWFKAKEVAAFLGYKWEAQAISNNVSSFNKRSWNDLWSRSTGPYPETPSNWQPNTIFINEPGLYQLMMRSKLPGMENFQNWVTSDVLPSIRKTGQYSIAPPDTNNQLIPFNVFISMLTQKDEQLAKKDEQLDKSLKITQQLADKVTQMMKYVAKQPSNVENAHVLRVYHTGEHDGKHLYRGIRRQQKYMKGYKAKENEHLIFNETSANPISAFNRVKDFIGEYKCTGNLLSCNVDAEEMKKCLELY